jgi:hypothetical protein
MNMKVRNALADPIVNCHERSVRFQSLLHRQAEEAGGFEQRSGFRSGQIAQSRKMFSRNQQTMSGKYRPVIEKCQAQVVLENDGRGYGARHDLAEQAIFRHFPMMPQDSKTKPTGTRVPVSRGLPGLARAVRPVPPCYDGAEY